MSENQTEQVTTSETPETLPQKIDAILAKLEHYAPVLDALMSYEERAKAAGHSIASVLDNVGKQLLGIH